MTHDPFAELTPDQCDRVPHELRERGLCVVRGVLAPPDVAAIKQRLAYIADHADFYTEWDVYFTPPAAQSSRQGSPLTRFQQIGNAPFLDADCRLHLLWQPNFIRIAAAVLGDDYNVVNAGFFLKPARCGDEVPWHQDAATWGVPVGAWTATDAPLIFDYWLAIDPVGRDNGALELLPGSQQNILPHKKRDGLLPEVDPATFGYDERTRVVITAEPGDLVIYHQDMLHRSEPNRSSQDRLAAAGTLVAPREIPRLRALLPHLPTLERCPILRGGRPVEIPDPLPRLASRWRLFSRCLRRRLRARLRAGRPISF